MIRVAGVHLDTQRPPGVDHGADQAELVERRRPQVATQVPGPFERRASLGLEPLEPGRREVGVRGDEVLQRAQLHGHPGEDRPEVVVQVAADARAFLLAALHQGVPGVRELLGQAHHPGGAGAVVGEVAHQLALTVTQGASRGQPDPERPAVGVAAVQDELLDRSTARRAAGDVAAAELRLHPARPHRGLDAVREAVEQSW